MDIPLTGSLCLVGSTLVYAEGGDAPADLRPSGGDDTGLLESAIGHLADGETLALAGTFQVELDDLDKLMTVAGNGLAILLLRRLAERRGSSGMICCYTL